MYLSEEHHYHYLRTDISLINDNSILTLLSEISDLRGEILRGMVQQFLTQSLHPFDNNQKRQPIKKSEFSIEQLLRSKVKDLKDTEIYKLCFDLVYFSGKGHIDDYDGTQVYVLLNKTIPNMSKGKKKKR